jgi:hypothetical protein
MSGQLHALAPQGNVPRYPLDKRLGGAQSQSACRGEEKISCQCRESKSDRSARPEKCPVTTKRYSRDFVCKHRLGSTELGYQTQGAAVVAGGKALFSSQESELLYDWLFTANHFVLATSPLRLTTGNSIFN